MIHGRVYLKLIIFLDNLKEINNAVDGEEPIVDKDILLKEIETITFAEINEFRSVFDSIHT